MRRLIALLVLILCCRALHAATYLIDPAKGSDDGDGSAAKPWKTLEAVAKSKKLTSLKGGDVVQLESGYHGDVVFAGDNESTVTIEAAKGAKPQLSRLNIRAGSNWLVKGLLISPSFAPTPYSDGYMVSFGPENRHGSNYVELAVISKNGQFRF